MSTTTIVDRQTTTPFLLKLFYKSNGWHRLDEFLPNATLPPHVQIYTWPSCSLRELTHLLTSAMPSILPSPAAGTRLAYRLIYPDARTAISDPSRPGRYLSKDLGSVVIGPELANGASNGAGGLKDDSERTLQEARFIIGDYVSCAVLPPLADGSVAPHPMTSGLPSRGGFAGGAPRAGYAQQSENGYSFRGRGPAGYVPEYGRGSGVPSGEWRRGERIPERGYGGGGGGGGSYRSRGRGRAW